MNGWMPGLRQGGRKFPQLLLLSVRRASSAGSASVSIGFGVIQHC
jgi:hypothetical protein